MYLPILSFFFFVFFQPYLQDHSLLRSRNVASMAKLSTDFSSLLHCIPVLVVLQLSYNVLSLILNSQLFPDL